MSQPNLSHLVVFSALARHLSFQKAAAEVGMSTSAVSHAIRGLEERLGISLFNRTTRSVALTDAGQRLMERLQPVLRDVADAIEEMNNFRAKPAGSLRINSSRVAAQLLVGPLMADFLARYPEIHLEVTAEDALVDIVAGGFDAGIRFHDSVPEDMVAIPIGASFRFAVVGSPAYFERHDVPVHPHDLFRHDCIRYRFASGRLFKWEFEKDGETIETDVKGRTTLNDQDLAVRAAVDGMGLAFVFEDYALRAIADGRLCRVLDDWCPSTPGFMIYYPRQRQLPSALRAFIDMVRARRGDDSRGQRTFSLPS